MIQIRKTWETVYFNSYKKGGYGATVELNLNRETMKYTITQSHEEGIRFDKDDCIEVSEQKVKALQAAINYIKEQTKLI